ncbi:MAG: hypothetical protein ICV77_14135 [Cyanobacteria bacterium Co-bin8]|nr:hypothetical protein [Cyanobacteria bacterium Co-bin8]
MTQQVSRSAHPPNSMDRAIRAFAAIPERTSLQIGITLCVHGMIISGFLISEDAYFQGLAERISEIKEAPDETKQTLTEFVSQLHEGLKAQTGNTENQLLPEYIHLREAKMYPSQGKGMPSYGEALWRGRISSVDGFSLGEILPSNLDGLSYTSFASK